MSSTPIVNVRVMNEGTTIHNRIAATWVSGQPAWDGATLLGEPVGQRLRFER